MFIKFRGSIKFTINKSTNNRYPCCTLRKNQLMSTILIGGGSGLIGNHLSLLLRKDGFDVIHLSRNPKSNSEFPTYQWNPIEGTIDNTALEKADYIINLAGAGIADKAWTAKRKKLIIDSRVKSNELLINSLKSINKKVKAFISASAVGYYGHRGSDKLTEKSKPGADGFLSESCMEWEKSIDGSSSVADRTSIIRIGIVLSTQGGALEKMILPFKFGVGNYFGDGSAYMPWIHIDDVAKIFIHAIKSDSFEGIYNGTAPKPVTGKEMATAIKTARDSFALIMPVPALFLKIGLGERVHMLTNSAKVLPEATLASGFKYEFPDVTEALKNILQRKI